MSLQIYVPFNNKLISLNTSTCFKYSTNVLASIPNILCLSVNENNLYTLIIIDIDAPTASNSKYSPFLHLILSNIQGKNIISINNIKNNYQNTTLVKSFYPANPPYLNDVHRYQFLLYEQSEKINFSLPNDDARTNFNLNSFIKQSKLSKLLDKVTLCIEKTS